MAHPAKHVTHITKNMHANKQELSAQSSSLETAEWVGTLAIANVQRVAAAFKQHEVTGTWTQHAFLVSHAPTAHTTCSMLA